MMPRRPAQHSLSPLRCLWQPFCPLTLVTCATFVCMPRTVSRVPSLEEHPLPPPPSNATWRQRSVSKGVHLHKNGENAQFLAMRRGWPLLALLSAICLSPGVPRNGAAQEAQASARFRLAAAPSRSEGAEAPAHSGLPPQMQLLVTAFAPWVPERCSRVRPVGDVPLAAGGIGVRVRPPHTYEAVRSILTAESGGALAWAALALAAGDSGGAAQWRSAAEKEHRLVPALIVHGHGLTQAQRYEDATLLLTMALHLVDPAHAAGLDALELLAVSLQHSNHLACAEAMHARALARDSTRALPHLNIGLLMLHSGRQVEARPHLQTAIALACGQDTNMATTPLCAPALQGLGSANALLSDQAAALRCFLACARLVPSQAQAQKDGPFIECYMSAAAVLQEMNEIDTAIMALNRAFRLLQPPRFPLDPSSISTASLARDLPLSLPLASALSSPFFALSPSGTHPAWDDWLKDERARICVMELTLLLASVADFRWQSLIGLVDRSLTLDASQVFFVSHLLFPFFAFVLVFVLVCGQGTPRPPQRFRAMLSVLL